MRNKSNHIRARSKIVKKIIRGILIPGVVGIGCELTSKRGAVSFAGAGSETTSKRGAVGVRGETTPFCDGLALAGEVVTGITGLTVLDGLTTVALGKIK